MRPISPDEVARTKAACIPEFVIEAFNKLIAANFDGHSSRFTKDEAVEEIESRSQGSKFDSRWLDIEPIYELEGWTVEYDKPGFNETYSATYTFKKGNRKCRSRGG